MALVTRNKRLARYLGAILLAASALFLGRFAEAQDAAPLPPPIVDSVAPPPPIQPRVLVNPTYDRPRPPVLNRSRDAQPPVPPTETILPNLFRPAGSFFRTKVEPPIGYTGPSSVIPSEGQTTDDFVPVEDRWRIGFPQWDRYDHGHPLVDDYPYLPGSKFDPFNQNVFKGDYPIIGQSTFLDLSGLANMNFEPRSLPTPASGGFESTARPDSFNFFGRNSSFITLDYFSLSADLFHGDAAFKPVDWRIKVTPTLGVSNFSFSERGVVSPNVVQGTQRVRNFWALQEAFAEVKLADTSPDYDFTSVRAGNQPFISDFRGFLFSDTNRAVRFFGTRNANRDQWNIAYFRQWEKDTNTALNTFNDRKQTLLFLNYYRQDFIVPGYTSQVSFTYNNDPRSLKYDKNRFLVRPDPVGNFQQHSVNVGYFGWAGDGHWGRYNLTHQFYWAVGRDSMNPIANQAQTISAQMAAVELSYDRDWIRFKGSFFYSSGDKNPNNSHATGFDTILDQPNFAGGPFSFWNRQQIPLFGVNLVQRLSLVPDLRASKIQSQANFVNPGILIPTLGFDLDLTPKVKVFNNMNVLIFDTTAPLSTLTFDGNIAKMIGVDLSTGIEYKPLLSENVVCLFGVSTLIPGQGLRDLYDNFGSRVPALVAGFATVNLAF
jgi:hypothetical protein